MNADCQAGMRLRQGDRVLKRRPSHHQATARQHAGREGTYDRFVYGLRDAKVVSIDDQPTWSDGCRTVRLVHQLACVATNTLRLVRSWRNSRASLYKRRRSRALNSARRTILKMMRGRK